jgi:hypothetical protein
MSGNESRDATTQARAVVLAWVRQRRPGAYATNEELAANFCALLPPDVDLALQTIRNPSALVYEARWYHAGALVSDFPKPFCAETAGDAQILACAAMVSLPD